MPGRKEVYFISFLLQTLDLVTVFFVSDCCFCMSWMGCHTFFPLVRDHCFQLLFFKFEEKILFSLNNTSTKQSNGKQKHMTVGAGVRKVKFSSMLWVPGAYGCVSRSTGAEFSKNTLCY